MTTGRIGRFRDWPCHTVMPIALRRSTTTAAATLVFALFQAIIINVPFARPVIEAFAAPGCANDELRMVDRECVGAAVAVCVESALTKAAAGTAAPRPVSAERNFSTARPTRIFAAASVML